MSDQIQIVVVNNPAVVTVPILPATSQNELPPPFQVSSSYSTKANTLTVQTSVLLPQEITDPGSSVTVQQYFDPNNSSRLQFYFVYDMADNGSGQYQEAIFKITADPAGIPLGRITETFMLTCDTDPKTSRGTTTTVRPTS